MMMAGPPCLMAHTPKRLDKFSAETLSRHMLSCGISSPSSSQLFNNEFNNPFSQNEINIDKIITADSSSQLSRERDQLLKRLLALKTWWERKDIFGVTNSAWRLLIQEAMQHIFDQMDSFFKSPILIFTLQMCFSGQAGYFNKPFVQMNLQLPKCSCKIYAHFLEALSPFGIQSLTDTSIIFGSPEPLAVILRACPELRILHLRNNSSDYIAKQAGKFCPHLQSFIIQDLFGCLMVSEECLYRTFFKGARKEEVIEGINGKRNISLSFPNLKCLDVGKSSQVLDFLFHIQYFSGPTIQSISCNTPNFSLESTFQNLPVSLLEQSFTFNIKDLLLTSNNLLAVGANIDNIINIFNKLKHITLSIDHLPADKEQEVINNSVKIIQNLKVTSFTVFIEYDNRDDEILLRIYTGILDICGTQLHTLQFHILRNVEWNLIIPLVNLCPNISLLGLNFCVDTTISRSSRFDCKFSPLHNLQHLSIFYEENISLSSFLDQLEEIITRSPKLITLELFLPYTACTWIMSIAANGYITSLEKLILGLQYVVYMLQPDIDLYVPVVEALTNLKTLVLVKVPDVILSHMKRIFNTSSLEIKSDCYSSIGYFGLYSKYKM